MKKNEIDQLIKKYHEGNTSEAEDRMLEEILMNDSSEEHISERKVMAFFTTERSAGLSAQFDSRFMKAIGKSPLRKSKMLMVWTIGIAASIAIFTVVVYLFNGYDRQVQNKTITTGLNERKEIQLPDGSTVFLNHKSAIRYDEDFEERKITLTGEAYFDVKSDKKNPFKINTLGSVTEVVGTSFNLMSNDENGVVELSVVKGSVTFSAYKDQLQERVFLSAGNQAVFDRKKNSMKKYEVSDPNILAWKTGLLVFDDSRIEEVALMLGRYFDHQVIVDNKALLNCHFNARFQKPSLSEVLDLLSFTMNIKSEIKGDTIKLYGNGCSQ